ncbi:MAG: NAD-dependent epimerase/dehydratase family protein [Flavobacteriales bacterium]|jgi:nucleoside-diphosphate-sugar epimerase
MQGTILVIGASGQIGTELVTALRQKWGDKRVIAADLRPTDQPELLSGPYIQLDTLDRSAVESVIDHYQITEVYQLAALLSATAERHPEKAWDLNMNGLFILLELCRAGKVSKLFWPSSIAVFGPTSPRLLTPQRTIMEPTSVYGISKQAGERWCEYYHLKHGVDVRSLRYPGLIGYRSAPGGGTTDYAVDIFYSAVENDSYTCFLSAGTMLPMMMMEDAIRATIELMETPASSVKIRSSYNLAGMSFTPEMIGQEIRKHQPGFRLDYVPDFRQSLADSWPDSIDDSAARDDWGWKPEYDLARLTEKMLVEIRRKKQASGETSGLHGA